MNDAIQKREAETVHAREAPGDSGEVGQEVRREDPPQEKAQVILEGSLWRIKQGRRTIATYTTRLEAWAALREMA